MSVPPARSGPRPCGSSQPTTGSSWESSSAPARLGSSSRTGRTAASANGSATRGSSRPPAIESCPTTQAGGLNAAGSALPAQPDAVVSLSAPASVGFLRGLDAVARLRAPVLFMAAQDDQPFSDDARSLYAAAASTDKQLQVVPGSAHGSGLLEDPSLKATVWSFIAAHTR